MTNTEFLINDFKEHPVQSSWDFEADLRFAKFIGDKEATDLIKPMLNGGFLPAILAIFHHTIRPRITSRRLRATRKLVEQGLVGGDGLAQENMAKRNLGLVGREVIFGRGNIMKIELCDCENMLLREIGDKHFYRNDIATTYALAIMQKTEKVDWAKVNRAILERWSYSALVYIKNRAWAIAEGRVDPVKERLKKLS